MMKRDYALGPAYSDHQAVHQRHDKVIEPLSSGLPAATPINNAQYNAYQPYGGSGQPFSPQTAQPGMPAAPQQPAEPFNPAVELIRSKLHSIYDNEPPAEQERQEAEAVHRRSKHQQFMHDLSNSGKSHEQIQIAWHNYYNNLSDQQKHEVWQEFYANQQQISQPPATGYQPQPTTPQPDPQPATQPAWQPRPAPQPQPQPAPQPAPQPEPQPVAAQPQPVVAAATPKPATWQAPQYTATPRRPVAAEPTPKDRPNDIKQQVLHTVRRRAKKTSSAKQHLQSLAFGLSLGVLAVIIMLFGFFNERFIAPFMTPSRSVSSTSIIIDPNSAAAGPDPVIIIPKINVEVPVIYDIDTIEEDAVQEGLERGTVHYFNTANPGENGNGVIFGHSSSNILNSGKYKFAFVLLRKLEKDDLFYLDSDGVRYVYRVYDKTIVPPNDVSVLYRNDRPSTMTLITCDPPGTNTNRLVVIGEQITPDPADNVARDNQTIPAKPEPATLPSNSPSLWSRIWGS